MITISLDEYNDLKAIIESVQDEEYEYFFFDNGAMCQYPVDKETVLSKALKDMKLAQEMSEKHMKKRAQQIFLMEEVKQMSLLNLIKWWRTNKR